MELYIFLILGFILLIGGSEFLIRGSVNLASILNVSPFIIGVVIVAGGTSLPELAACLQSIRLNVEDIVIGNIVGSVDDESDMREPVTAVGEKAFQVDGIMSVDDANETLSLGIPEGEYNTVAGYLLNEIGRIPAEGELVTLNDLSILVAKMQGTKIEKLVVERRS